MKDKIKQWLDDNRYYWTNGSLTKDGTGEVIDVDAIEQCFEALQPQWVSVKTELPTEWVRVLVGNSVMTGNAYRYNGQWRLSASNDLILDKDITHWMNRPLPPSEGE